MKTFREVSIANYQWLSCLESQGIRDSRRLEAAVMHWGFHEVLYGTIKRHCPPPAKILDVGSGPGWLALYPSAMGYDVTGVDSLPAPVDTARDLSERLGARATFTTGDAFDLGLFYGQFVRGSRAF